MSRLSRLQVWAGGPTRGRLQLLHLVELLLHTRIPVNVRIYAAAIIVSAIGGGAIRVILRVPIAAMLLAGIAIAIALVGLRLMPAGQYARRGVGFLGTHAFGKILI